MVVLSLYTKKEGPVTPLLHDLHHTVSNGVPMRRFLFILITIQQKINFERKDDVIEEIACDQLVTVSSTVLCTDGDVTRASTCIG